MVCFAAFFELRGLPQRPGPQVALAGAEDASSKRLLGRFAKFRGVWWHYMQAQKRLSSAAAAPSTVCTTFKRIGAFF